MIPVWIGTAATEIRERPQLLSPRTWLFVRRYAFVIQDTDTNDVLEPVEAVDRRGQTGVRLS